ncbi:MAG: hypothetical protein JXB50_11960 [Spirochaetes bacterium]|nr:hypothetical protein [Spirochaetota bacterium]
MAQINKNLSGNNFFKSDKFYIILLVLLLFVYMLPGLISVDKAFFDDSSLCFSRIVGAARLIKGGEIPLWDPNTFMGARPYYVMVESPIYNILLYPLFFLADLDNINQSFTVLYMIPYTLLLMVAAAGVFLFTRKIFNFNAFASFVSGFLYAASPKLAASFKSIHNTQVFALIPWVLLFIFLYIHFNKIKWWFLSVLFLVFLSTSVTLNYIIRSYFLMGIIVFFSCMFLFIKKQIKIMSFINSLLIFLFSFSLLMFIWTGMFEGAKWVQFGTSFKFKDLVAYPHYNMFPGYIANLFMQDFHGLVSSSHAWGNAVKYDNNILLSGSFFSSLMIFLSVMLFFKYRKADRKKSELFSYRNQVYFWIMFFIFIFSMLVMMGKFTPLYFIFCTLIPWVFKFPYAFYFLFYQAFTFSVMVGFGINILLQKDIINELNKNKLFIYYIVLVILMLAIALIEPVYTQKGFISFQSMVNLKETNWFFINKVLMLLLFIIALIFFYYNLKKLPYLKYILAGIIILESFIFGYISLYRNTMSARLFDHPNKYRIAFQTHYKRPLDHPLLKDTVEFKNFLKDKDDRYVGTISTIDNIAWLIDKKSTFGYDSKPVTRQMYNIIHLATDNYPYELYLRGYPYNLLKNLNIGHLVTFKYHTIKLMLNNAESLYMMLDEPKYLERIKKDWIEVTPINLANDKNKSDFDLVAYKLFDPLPYFYFHDKIEAGDDKTQLNKLIFNDMREKIFMNQKDYDEFMKNSPVIDADNKEDNKDDKLKYFNELQETNKITKMIKNKANTVAFEVDVKKRTLLVRNESFHDGWSVYITKQNDKIMNRIKSKVLKVNYIQQGVVMEPGRYKVEYKYFPDSMKKGFVISLLVLIIFAVYSLYLFYDKRSKG